MRTPRDLTFRSSDITRAIKAAKAAGVANPRIEVSKSGVIAIIPQPGDAPGDDPNPWDKHAQNKKRSAKAL
jgi:hypothetical protein